jgi:tRNA A58 N-methylase Trm61
LTDRQKILRECGVAAESVVLEIGAGNGFFTEALSEKAKKVIAVELQPGMVRKLEKRLGRLRDKVEIIRGDVAAADLGECIADICLLYYCFHEIRRKEDAARNIAKAVKSGGVLAIYEPRVEVSGRAMRDAIALFADNGFFREAERNDVFTRFARLRKE